MREHSCVHFNGLMNDICLKDIDYLTVAILLTQEQIEWHNENYPRQSMERTAISKRIPCLGCNEIKTCEHFRLPTPEELAEQDCWIAKVFSESMTARKAITDHLEQEGLIGSTVTGQIECPICHGKLNWTYAGSYNHHIHARCVTAECVNFME